ncbi:MAG: SDR family NAD(P)-dependent oxidoreductase [Chloroflexota bacterium]
MVNNAGVWMNGFQETEDGFEITWQVNHVAPFLLTRRLLPALLQRADARVINISSSGHRSGKIHFDNVNLRRDFNGMRAYLQSKLANVLFTQELARHTQGLSLIAHAVDPGAVQTQLLAETGFNVPTVKPTEEIVGRVGGRFGT